MFLLKHVDLAMSSPFYLTTFDKIIIMQNIQCVLLYIERETIVICICIALTLHVKQINLGPAVTHALSMINFVVLLRYIKTKVQSESLISFAYLYSASGVFYTVQTVRYFFAFHNIILPAYNFLFSFQHIILVDGNWTEWSSWTECSTSCGGGIMSRNRTCSDPEPQFNGLDCSDINTEKDSCNENHCPSKTDFFLFLLLIYIPVHSPPLTNIFTSLILTMNIIFMKKKCL